MSLPFTSNGLGQPLCTEWQAMDVPVGPTLGKAGPDGWMEFKDDMTAWRMWRPFNWSLGG